MTVSPVLTPFSQNSPSSITTWYVRSDGGSPQECTGTVDAAYPGSGSNQPCAWDHPYRAFPPLAEPQIAGGDTLIIAPGEYMMGYGAPGTNLCEADSAFDCHMPPIPSGPGPEKPTRILGAGWDTGCADRPQLWGTERPWLIVNLTGSSNVTIGCLEITDHSSCVEDHSGGLACERENFPYGPWAPVGIYAEDSANAHLHDLSIHGLASTGIQAGRLQDWTVERVQITSNGWAGWDGDIPGDDENTGILRFRNWTVSWNGCGETWPGGLPTGCWSQTAGGYGDGVGTGATGGDWIIENSQFLHNTSDGLDLLYHSLGGRIQLNRVHAEGNAGNQVKTTGQASILNSVLVGNCGFFDEQPFTFQVDACRALGNTLAIFYTGGEQVSIVNSTFYGEGDGLISGGPREGFQCNGSEALSGRNNIFMGDRDYFDPADVSFLFYQEGCQDLALDSDYSISFQVKNIDCRLETPYVRSGTHDLCLDPLLLGPIAGEVFGLSLTPSSPAIGSAAPEYSPPIDFTGQPRDAEPDIGAIEWRK